MWLWYSICVAATWPICYTVSRISFQTLWYNPLKNGGLSVNFDLGKKKSALEKIQCTLLFLPPNQHQTGTKPTPQYCPVLPQNTFRIAPKPAPNCPKNCVKSRKRAICGMIMGQRLAGWGWEGMTGREGEMGVLGNGKDGKLKSGEWCPTPDNRRCQNPRTNDGFSRDKNKVFQINSRFFRNNAELFWKNEGVCGLLT